MLSSCGAADSVKEERAEASASARSGELLRDPHSKRTLKRIRADYGRARAHFVNAARRHAKREDLRELAASLGTLRDDLYRVDKRLRRMDVNPDAAARLNEIIEWTTVVVHEIDGVLLQHKPAEALPMLARTMRHVVTAQADPEALIRKL